MELIGQRPASPIRRKKRRNKVFIPSERKGGQEITLFLRLGGPWGGLFLWAFSQEVCQLLKQEVFIQRFAKIIIATGLPGFFLVSAHCMR